MFSVIYVWKSKWRYVRHRIYSWLMGSLSLSVVEKWNQRRPLVTFHRSQMRQEPLYGSIPVAITATANKSFRCFFKIHLYFSQSTNQKVTDPQCYETCVMLWAHSWQVYLLMHTEAGILCQTRKSGFKVKTEHRTSEPLLSSVQTKAPLSLSQTCFSNHLSFFCVVNSVSILQDVRNTMDQ